MRSEARRRLMRSAYGRSPIATRGDMEQPRPGRRRRVASNTSAIARRKHFWHPWRRFDVFRQWPVEAAIVEARSRGATRGWRGATSLLLWAPFRNPSRQSCLRLGREPINDRGGVCVVPGAFHGPLRGSRLLLEVSRRGSRIPPSARNESARCIGDIKIIMIARVTVDDNRARSEFRIIVFAGSTII